jgi:CheY-like chemotaxis protein
VDGTLHHERSSRRETVLLRGMLIVVVGVLLIDGGIARASAAALAFVLVFALSNALLPFLPGRLIGSRRFDLMLGASDLALVGLGIHLAGALGGALPISCLLMTLVMAIGDHRVSTVAGGAAVGALHAWLLTRTSPGAGLGRQLLPQMLFLCAVGLYYGFLTERIRHRRKAESAGGKDRDLETFLDILDTTTRSSDLRQVSLSIVSKLTAIVPAVRCSIVLAGAGGERAHVLVSHDDPAIDMLELDLGKYPEIREALRSRSPIVVQDMLHNPMMAEVRDRLTALDFQSLIVVPLTFGEEVMGALCIKAARVNQAFTRREVDFCCAAARAAAHVLHGARLQRRLNEEIARGEATEGARILVADDDPPAVDLVTATLEGIGHEVDTARNDMDAYGKARERRYDLVVAGIRLPRMNGIDLYRRLLRRRPEMRSRFLFVTDDPIDPEARRFLEETGARALARPLRAAEVSRAVREMLGSRDSSAVA